jgi:hypothetical protein
MPVNMGIWLMTLFSTFLDIYSGCCTGIRRTSFLSLSTLSVLTRVEGG